MTPDRSVLTRWTETATREGRPLASSFRGWASRSRELLKLRLVGGDFEERLQLLRAKYGEDGTDEFGLTLGTYEAVAQFFGFLHRMYFRSEVHGIDRLPQGRVLIVANHSGQIPLDAIIIGSSLFFDTKVPRVTRAMIDRWAGQLPFVSEFFTRLGSVVGTPDNARQLLSREEAVLVFPEGIRGISKPFTQRYQLQDFGHGFARLAIETDTPIVPVAVIGAEEQYINLGNSATAARLLNAPVCPLIPQVFLPFGQLPLPTKYRLYFGEPMRLCRDGRKSGQSISDQVFLVRQSIQSMLSEGLRQRRGVFF